jgi:hypothetical protein
MPKPPREVTWAGPSHRRAKPVIKPEPMRNLKPIPRYRTKEQREHYLSRKSVQRWLVRNASDLKRVVDVRHTYQCEGTGVKAEHCEWAEIYYVVKRDGVKALKIRIISGDPPPKG